MTEKVERHPGKAVADGGVVILAGPDSVAVSMTGRAARRTGRSLLRAARALRKRLDD